MTTNIHLRDEDQGSDTKFSIAISMRGERDVGLNNDNHLIFRHGLRRLSMGAMSINDIDNLCEYLQRLKIHLPVIKWEIPNADQSSKD